MNDFCLECTGYSPEEIEECDDKNCPFHHTRFSNLPYQEEKKSEIK